MIGSKVAKGVDLNRLLLQSSRNRAISQRVNHHERVRAYDWKTSINESKACCSDWGVPNAKSSSER